MKYYLIAMFITAIVLGIIHVIRVIIVANQFLDYVDFAVDLEAKLFNDEKTAEEYKDKKIIWFVVKWDFTSDNFADAVECLRFITQKGIDKYEKINLLTTYFDFTMQKGKLEKISHDAKMWLWKQGYYSDENKTEGSKKE